MKVLVWNSRWLQWENKQTGKWHQAAKTVRKKLTKYSGVLYIITISKGLKTSHCQKTFVYIHIFILEAEKQHVPYKSMAI